MVFKNKRKQKMYQGLPKQLCTLAEFLTPPPPTPISVDSSSSMKMGSFSRQEIKEIISNDQNEVVARRRSPDSPPTWCLPRGVTEVLCSRTGHWMHPSTHPPRARMVAEKGGKGGVCRLSFLGLCVGTWSQWKPKKSKWTSCEPSSKRSGKNGSLSFDWQQIPPILWIDTAGPVGITSNRTQATRQDKTCHS